MKRKFLMAPFWAVAIVLVVASFAWACGAITGSFTVEGQNGVSVTSQPVNPPGHDAQSLTGGVAQSCGGTDPTNPSLSNGVVCPLGTNGWIKISTGRSGNSYLPPSATPIPAGQCQPLGIVINQCADAGTPIPNPTLGPYLVRYLNGPVYQSHTGGDYGLTDPTNPPGYSFPNCGFYGNGNLGFVAEDLGKVTVGSSASDTTGAITGLVSSNFGGSYLGGGVVKLTLPLSAKNAAPTESSVCIVDRFSQYANIDPISIV